MVAVHTHHRLGCWVGWWVVAVHTHQEVFGRLEVQYCSELVVRNIEVSEVGEGAQH